MLLGARKQDVSIKRAIDNVDLYGNRKEELQEKGRILELEVLESLYTKDSRML